MLSRTYPEAIAGTPTSWSFDPTSARFTLAYRASRSVKAPTVVFVPTALHYPDGYCAKVVGGTVTSARDSRLLLVRNGRRARTVSVTVTPGRCSRRS